MAATVERAKYTRIVDGIQQAVISGRYRPGDMIPSETDLVAEFGASRATVIKALTILQEHGWLEARHGKGRFVRSRRPRRDVPAHLGDALGEETAAGVRLVKVGAIVAPRRVADALGLPDDMAVYARQRLVSVEGLGPVELGCTYVPVELSIGSRVASLDPIDGDVLAHLADVHGIEWDYAAQTISARTPYPDEARLLEIGRRDPVLAVFAVCHDRTGRALLVSDVVMPGTRHEIDDEIPLQ